MKNSVNTYISYFTLVSLILVSCLFSCSDDNFIEEETLIETSAPDTIGYTFLTGRILDSKGEKLSNILVEYLVDGEIKSVETNADGIYEIKELEESVKRTTLRCHGEGYLPKVEVIQIENSGVVENDVILASVEQANPAPTAQLAGQSITDSLIGISGRIVNNNEEPVPGVIVYLVNFTFTTFLYAITDADGFYEFATEPLPEAVILIGSECENIQTLAGPVNITDDKVFEDFTTNIVQSTFVNYSGFVKDCYTGEGLVFGSIRFQFEGEVSSATADINNGLYNIDIPQCLDYDCINVTIFSYQTQTGTDELACLEFQQGNNILDYEVCNTPNATENEGELIVNLNGEEISYPLAGVEESLNNYVIVGADLSTQSVLILTTKNKDSQGLAENLGIGNLISGTLFYNSLPDQISYQIDSTTVEFMYGSFEGKIINSGTGQPENIDGTFKAAVNQ